jgi:type II secretory pathway component PulJ
LIELLVVVTIASLVLASVGVALHSLFRVDRTLRQGMVSTMMATRLSMQLRSDLHRAASVERSAGEKVVLTLREGGTVEYVAEKQYLLRVALSGAKVLRREQYLLPEKAAIRWELRMDQSPPLVGLHIVREAGSIPGAEDARRIERIEAVVGLDGQIAGGRR